MLEEQAVCSTAGVADLVVPQPAHVRPPKALVGRVWVQRCVRVQVVVPVV